MTSTSSVLDHSHWWFYYLPTRNEWLFCVESPPPHVVQRPIGRASSSDSRRTARPRHRVCKCRRRYMPRQQKINEMNGAHLVSPIRGELGYAHWPQLGTQFIALLGTKFGP